MDDWSLISQDSKVNPLELSFTVISPEIIAVVLVGTAPKLLSYANKFRANLEAQREGAAKESIAFRVSRAPKPDNPLSAVAEAMFESARSRFKQDTGLSYTIRQKMALRLEHLRLIVFPRTMADHEMAQFVGRNVHARLTRLVQSESDFVPVKKDIHLEFSSMMISRFTQLMQSPVDTLNISSLEGQDADLRVWIQDMSKAASEANVVGLPSMTMDMVSDEFWEDADATASPSEGENDAVVLSEATPGAVRARPGKGSRVLEYDFDSKFIHHMDQANMDTLFEDDIYITLNVSLYSWLTLMRRNLSREMDQVRLATDWRATRDHTMNVSLHIPNTSRVRRNAPDSLQLGETPKSAGGMSHKGLTTPMSPFGFSQAHTPRSANSMQGAFFHSPRDMTSPMSDNPLTVRVGSTDLMRDRTLTQDSDDLITPLSMSVSPSLDVQSSERMRHLDNVSSKPADSRDKGKNKENEKDKEKAAVIYRPRTRHIERLTMRQLGEATPDVMHPFFMKKAGFSLEDSLPQYVNEYATVPLEQIMEVLLKLYGKQLASSAK
jgi:hypothetical protein